MKRLPRAPAALVAGLVLTGLAGPFADPAPSAQNGARELRSCVNAERQRLDIRTLKPSSTLARAARAHARAMASGRAPFDHTDARGRGPAERVRAAGGGFRGVGENIAYGQRSARSACRTWRRSSGHYANWTHRSYAAIGTAVAAGPRGRMYVQVFGTR